MHPCWCLQQILDLSYVLRILLGKPNLSLMLPSVLDTDVTPRLLSPVGNNLRSKRFSFHSSAAGRASSLLFTHTHTPSLSHLFGQQDSRIAGSLRLFPLRQQTRLYLHNICAVTVVRWQKGNPQAIQPLHLPAWTEFPYSCLLTGVKQVLGRETSWEIQ